jgi:bacteriocin biosynthesis cyclodehydratase domain-containing protein
MVLKLDSRVPVVWRNPFNLQFGVEPVRVILREVTPAQERMIAALSSGVSRSGLSMIGRASGADELAISRLLDAITPVLEPQEPPISPFAVAISGVGPTAELIASALSRAGLTVSVTAGPPDSPTDLPADLGIAIGHFVLEPELYGYWLRRDLPHLPIIFGENSVTMGPVVEPGAGPCLFCLERYRTDADAMWPAIASQLWGRKSAAETALVSNEIASIVARLVLARLRFGATAAATSIRLDAETGELSRREWLAHPQCGCLAVDPTTNPVRRESDSFDAAENDSSPPPPTTARVGDAPS